MMQKDQKTSIIEANRTHATDTGSPEVQVAILTERDQPAHRPSEGSSPRLPQPSWYADDDR